MNVEVYKVLDCVTQAAAHVGKTSTTVLEVDWARRPLLALDLGTKTGFALSFRSHILVGSVQLAKAAEVRKDRENARSDDPRPLRLRRFLFSLARCLSDAGEPLQEVWWEDVEFSTYTYQTQLWAALKTAASMFACDFNVQASCLGVSKLKKSATGHGGATKGMMLAYFKKHHHTNALDKNPDAVDAYHLLSHATVNRK